MGTTNSEWIALMAVLLFRGLFHHCEPECQLCILLLVSSQSDHTWWNIQPNCRGCYFDLCTLIPSLWERHWWYSILELNTRLSDLYLFLRSQFPLHHLFFSTLTVSQSLRHCIHSPILLSDHLFLSTLRKPLSLQVMYSFLAYCWVEPVYRLCTLAAWMSIPKSKSYFVKIFSFALTLNLIQSITNSGILYDLAVPLTL